MNEQPGDPDPSPYIARLSNGSAFHREAAAWTLGELGCQRAARPLAGLVLRELESVEQVGYLTNSEVVRAAVTAIRRIGSPEPLYCLVKALCTLSRSHHVERSVVMEIVESLASVGGFHAVREAADKVVRHAKDGVASAPGLDEVGDVLFARLGLCGDAGIATLRRLSGSGPAPLRTIAKRALARL